MLREKPVEIRLADANYSADAHRAKAALEHPPQCRATNAKDSPNCGRIVVDFTTVARIVLLCVFHDSLYWAASVNSSETFAVGAGKSGYLHAVQIVNCLLTDICVYLRRLDSPCGIWLVFFPVQAFPPSPVDNIH